MVPVQVVQLVKLIKEVALTLNAHFPGHLAALWLVDCPSVVEWPLRALRKLLHPATGQKIRTCTSSSPDLPLNLLEKAVDPSEAIAMSEDGEAEGEEESLDELGEGRDGVHFWYV